MKMMFRPHGNLSDEINRRIIQSEIEGGVYLKDLPHQSTLEVATRNRAYTITLDEDGTAWISGHPEYCPRPVLCRIVGSNWGGSMIKTAYLGRGMRMEFRHPEYRGPIVTSPIIDIKLRAAA